MNNMISKYLLITTATFFLFTLLSRVSSAASPPAPAPTGSPTPDVYKILTKAGQFSILIRLLRSTKVGDQINNQLSTAAASSSAGLTFFAPTDNAFAGLESGTLNRLSDQQKVQLIQFHIVPTFVSISSFQTLTNPVQTQASDSYQFPLNVTTDTGGQQVNITTGIVNATISGTVFSDDAGQLAVYQLDKVLQPLGIFDPRPPPPPAGLAPAPKKKKVGESDDQAADGADSGGSATATWAAGIMLSCFVLSVSFGWS